MGHSKSKSKKSHKKKSHSKSKKKQHSKKHSKNKKSNSSSGSGKCKRKGKKSKKSHHRNPNCHHRHPAQDRKIMMKGKLPPNMKGKKILQTPSQMTPEQMTTIYTVPDENFQTEEEVAKYNGYEIMQQIAKGGFAVIYKSKNIKTGKLAACKLVNLGNDPNSGRISEMKNELFIMELMNNSFAIKLYLHYLVNSNLYIFMQFAEAGSFGKLLEKDGVMNEKECKYYFSQMIVGIEHMHDLFIAHRDIKPANFLMSEIKGHKIVLVSDYGLSRLVHTDERGDIVLYKTQCGTPAYMAPEVLAGQAYNSFLIDVWSLAVTLYAMLNMMTPFDVNKEDYGVQDMMSYNWQFSDAMKENPTEGLQEIMNAMLEPDPTKRLTIKDISKHSWLAPDYDRTKKLEKSLK